VEVTIGGVKFGLWGLFVVALLIAASIYLGIRNGWLQGIIVLGGVLAIWSGIGWPDKVKEVGPFLALIGFAVCYFKFEGETAKREFYVLAAEVIPLLFLGMVAARQFSLVGKEIWFRQARILLIYVLIVGEGYSLFVIAAHEQPRAALGNAVGALVAAAITIVTEAIGTADTANREPDAEP
jgi:hypothetical protein